MKVLWVGDAVVTSGFALCTHAACDEMHRRGWDVNVIGINYQGDPHDYPYRIYVPRVPFTAMSDQFGVSRLPYLIDQLKPDAVVILQDPWNIPHYLESVAKFREREPLHTPKMIAWLAVDSHNQKSAPALANLDHVCVWTDFAKEELRTSGYFGPCEIVPLGVDTSVFRPCGDDDNRLRMSNGALTSDHFVFGSVGRNQTRKRLDLTIQYFAEVARQYDHARLVLHIAPTGDRGYDLESLRKYYGMKDKVLISRPTIGYGAPQEELARAYCMFDCFISTSIAEGWCLPALEAMACGTPCVLPAHSGFDWARGAALMAGSGEPIMAAPENGLMHTIGAIPDREEFVNAMGNMLVSKALQWSYSQAGLQLAQRLTWESSANGICNQIEKIVAAGASCE